MLHLSNKPIVLSIDLDNTLVNRSKGGNAVDEKMKACLIELSEKKKATIIPNSGRDIIGVRSFFRDVYPFHNAIMGSGSVILHKEKISFFSESEVANDVVDGLVVSVQNKTIPFIDVYHSSGRVIFCHQDFIKKYSGLFYQQNPQEWFSNKIPPVFEISEFIEKKPTEIFRIEFPVRIEQGDLYQSLIDKKSDSLHVFNEMVNLSIDESVYRLKRKKFFCEAFQDELTFARLEKDSKYVNKGLGLKFWLDQESIPPEEVEIIHIGDQDTGLINDTLIKELIPSAHLVMVGTKCSQHNPLVDLYLLDPDIDKSLGEFFSRLVKRYVE